MTVRSKRGSPISGGWPEGQDEGRGERPRPIAKGARPQIVERRPFPDDVQFLPKSQRLRYGLSMPRVRQHAKRVLDAAGCSAAKNRKRRFFAVCACNPLESLDSRVKIKDKSDAERVLNAC